MTGAVADNSADSVSSTGWRNRVSVTEGRGFEPLNPCGCRISSAIQPAQEHRVAPDHRGNAGYRTNAPHPRQPTTTSHNRLTLLLTPQTNPVAP